MAYPIVRIYETEHQAREAVAKLREGGFFDDTTFLVTPHVEGEAGPAGALANAIMTGRALGDDAGFYVDRLQHGRSLVVVQAPFGAGARAIEIMDGCGPVDTDIGPPKERDPWGVGAPFSASLFMPVLSRGTPAPFSGFFGLPMLVTGRTSFAKLASPNYAVSNQVGLGLLSRNAAPLSSLFRFPLLTKRAAPLSSLFWFPLLTRNGAPLSSLFRIPLKSRNPTPLSSLFSLPLLTEQR